MSYSICVFCGSSCEVDLAYLNAAKQLGLLLAQHGITLVYGGGQTGMMGHVAEGALEAGGKVIGVIPQHLQERENAHTGLSELIVTENMHQRKAVMFEYADLFVALPGGVGTLDELLEILTWRQLDLHKKPVFLINLNNYWAPLLALFTHMVQEGYLRADSPAIPRLLSDPNELLDVYNLR